MQAAICASGRQERLGAADQIIKALATIAAETGDEDIDRIFELASALHTNFYEDWYRTGRIQHGLRDIETFLDELQQSVNE